MKFLFDNNAPPDAADLLRQSGVEATHVKEIGHDASSDRTIMRLAVETDATVVTCDNDFPEMLAHSRASEPSVILLREGAPMRPHDLANLLAAHPEAVERALSEGAMVVIDGRQMRIRRLPLR